MTPRLFAACQDAVHVIMAKGEILRAGRAALFILEEIGYPAWLVRPFTEGPLILISEWSYQLVAQNRSFFARFLFTAKRE